MVPGELCGSLRLYETICEVLAYVRGQLKPPPNQNLNNEKLLFEPLEGGLLMLCDMSI